MRLLPCLLLLLLAPTAHAADAAAPPPLEFFWGIGCPHCADAEPFVDRLERETPGLRVERIEVRQDPEGRRRFHATLQRLGITTPGIPIFVVGDRSVMGFRPGHTEAEVIALLRAAAAPAPEVPSHVDLPFLGRVDARRLPLPALTVVIGLLDGINPCAMWVLLVMLGILLRVRSRARMALFGAIFVALSGVVYFLFMTAWTRVFLWLGGSRLVVAVLAVALAVMGLINLKELLWFKRGVSLTIPDSAKPALYRRMRAVAQAASLPAAVLGIAALALIVNLVELGCTIGLPAVYTRILTWRTDLSTGARYAYLGLYNLAYIVPLGLILVIYILTLRRLSLSARAAQVLKGVSGVLLLLFAALILAQYGTPR
jgi:thiol-disulfide isomerase/thioredoxin